MTPWLNSLLSPLLAATLKILLVDAAHTHTGTEEFLEDIDSGARIAMSLAIESKAVSGGSLTGTCSGFTSLTGDDAVRAYLVHDTGDESTSRLLRHWDESEAFTLSPDGNNVSVAFTGSILTIAAA
ncbi:MAG: hypothetical protein ACPGVY_14530 [Mycobacterium sp.]